MAPHYPGCKSFIGPQRHGSRWFYHGLFSLLVLLVAAMVVPAGFAQTAPAVITWSSPAAIPYGTPLSGIQLNATATTIAPVIISLPYNVDGISAAGQPVAAGGYDNQGYAFDTTLLGSSIQWNGLTYSLGPMDAPDAVSNTTITIPAAQQGSYASFVVLGSSINNASSSSYSFTFTANYTDGTSTALLPQQMSDWAHPQDFPGESVAKCTPSRVGPSGSEPVGVCVYAYQILLDPGRVLQSITLPTTTTPRKAVVLGMGLIPPTVPGTFSYSPDLGTVLPVGTNPLSVQFTPAGSSSPISGPSNVSVVVDPAMPTIAWTQPAPINYGTLLGPTQLDATATVQSGAVIVPLSAYYNVNSFYPSGADAVGESTNGGFNGAFDEYSDPSFDVTPTAYIAYNGINFPLGATGEPDSVSSLVGSATSGPATGTVIALPAGSFSTLSMIGAATAPGQKNQTFTVTYTDTSTATTSVNLSSWTQSSGYTGETVVSTTPSPHSAVLPAPQIAGPVNIYGYQIPVDSTKTLQSITLPASRDVVIFAMALSSSSPAAVPVPGSFAYTPPSGTMLPVGTDETLSVSFTPTGPTGTIDYADATGTTTITVNQLLGATATLNWPTPASITYGTPLSATQLDATASLPNGTALQGTPVYTPAAGAILGAGTQTLSVIFTPNSGSDLAPINGSVKLTVAKAPVTIAINFSATSITAGSNETITVTVASTTIGTPTGTVTLLDNGNALGSLTLVNGVATYSTTTLPSGTDVITAVYSGDSNFLGTSTASTASVSNTIMVNAIPPVLDFTFTPTGSTTVQGAYGKPQQLTFHLAPIGGAYPSTVLFSAISPPGLVATYTFSPASVAQNAGPTDITLTVLTSASTALNSLPSWTDKRSAIGFAFLLLPLLGLRYSRSSGRRLTRLISCAVLMALSLGAVGLVTGCGSDSFERVFQITVSATSGTDQHAVGVNYEVGK